MTVIVVALISSAVYGVGCGVCAALLHALDLQMSDWFPSLFIWPVTVPLFATYWLLVHRRARVTIPKAQVL